MDLTRPGANDYMDDTGYEGDVVMAEYAAAIESLVLPLIVNGNMDHFRGVSGSGTQTSTTTYSTTTSYAADQMYVLPAGASVSVKRSATVPDSKSRYSLEVDGASSVTTVDIGQRIEAAVVNTRGLQSLVFSCYVYNNSGAAFTPNLRVGTPGAADDFTTVTNRLNQALDECADGEWTRLSYVFDPSGYTNVANGLDVALRVPSGSLVASDVVLVSQFDLRPGAAVAPYLAPDPDLEYVRCLRYYERFIYTSTAHIILLGNCGSSGNVVRGVMQYARKRTAPSVSISDASHFVVRDAGFSADVTLSGFASSGSINEQQAGMAATVTSPQTTGDCLMVRCTTANGWVAFNARL